MSKNRVKVAAYRLASFGALVAALGAGRKWN